ncbi:hypothetical protein HMPREF1982_00758 [Clostridiales bacterium oral taxon 876 str. F0540]|nr:hypothetical protein HMPREF1982_00758 [Clostridiales bacterium oral taxon 876 str. F0540]
MLIVGLFTKYFLILMLLEGVIVGFIDAPSYKRQGMNNSFKKARVAGICFIVIGFLLYFIRMRLQ